MLQAFIDLCQQPIAAYLDRFNFKSPLLKSMYAVTDGFSGLNGSWQTAGTGMNFLMHNMVSKAATDIPTTVQASLITNLSIELPATVRCIGPLKSWQVEGSN